MFCFWWELKLIRKENLYWYFKFRFESVAKGRFVKISQNIPQEWDTMFEIRPLYINWLSLTDLNGIRVGFPKPRFINLLFLSSEKFVKIQDNKPETLGRYSLLFGLHFLHYQYEKDFCYIFRVQALATNWWSVPQFFIDTFLSY